MVERGEECLGLGDVSEHGFVFLLILCIESWVYADRDAMVEKLEEMLGGGDTERGLSERGVCGNMGREEILLERFFGGVDERMGVGGWRWRGGVRSIGRKESFVGLFALRLEDGCKWVDGWWY